MKSARMSFWNLEYYREDCQSELYYRKENGKYQLNLWRANEIVMEEAGILPENIHTTQWCTCCNPELCIHTCLKRQTWQSGSISRTEEERMIL